MNDSVKKAIATDLACSTYGKDSSKDASAPERHKMGMKEKWLLSKVDGVKINDIISVLTDGLADRCGFEAVDNDCDPVDINYKHARSSLLEMGFKEEGLCLEEVQAKMLADGGFMAMKDPEGTWHALTIKPLCEAIKEAKLNFDEADFYDYDAVLQKAVYGEVIYG
mgnify:FL=1